MMLFARHSRESGNPVSLLWSAVNDRAGRTHV